MITRLTLPAVLLAASSIPNVAWAVASAELYTTQPYQYGRFEARVRYAAGGGVVSAFFLWKEGSEVAGTFWNELDFEKIGANCELQTNAFYGNPEVVHKGDYSGPELCSDYHDYLYEWTPTYIAWAVDGQEIRRETGETATAFAENATEGMTFHFNIWPGDASFGGTLDPAILPVYQYISWVQYSSYNNGDFTLEWREEFDGSSLPSGWETGTWESPKNQSTHNPDNVGFVNGIAVLALTADDATGVPSTVPADGNATGGAGTGGASSGGANTGGMAEGGTGTGGAGMGGTATGGTTGGGADTGTGGVGTGGTSGGAANTGGTAMGGANTGGISAGGTATGGVSDASGATGGASIVSTATGGTATSTGSGGGTTEGFSTGGSGAQGATAGEVTPTGTGATDSTGWDGQGADANSPVNTETDNSGCTCRVQADGDGAWWHSTLGLLGLLLLLRRRAPARGPEHPERCSRSA